MNTGSSLQIFSLVIFVFVRQAGTSSETVKMKRPDILGVHHSILTICRGIQVKLPFLTLCLKFNRMLTPE